MINVVVVDDSAFMRKALATMLEKDPEIRVVATARNGEEGLEMIRKHDPQVVTLDIEMPRMDGLTALEHIMKEMPRPVLMVSSLTTEGAEATLKAMELGAVDFIPKQLSKVSLDIVRIEQDLQNKVKTLGRRRLARPSRISAPSGAGGTSAAPGSPSRLSERTPARPLGQLGTRSGLTRPSPESATRPLSGAAAGAPRTATRPSGAQKRDLVAIGVSTGGPPAVQKVLSSLPGDFPAAILIAQHMPAAFTGPFAKRLDGVSKLTVKEAEDGEPLRAGHVYIAPGGKHIVQRFAGGKVVVGVTPDPVEALYKPSANVLMESVAQLSGRKTLAAILTGMGNDGMEGVKVVKQKGGRALAQSDATCVVYGMPKAIVDAGLADEIVDIDEMAQAILNSLYL